MFAYTTSDVYLALMFKFKFIQYIFVKLPYHGLILTVL
jgi:hypothetical protein